MSEKLTNEEKTKFNECATFEQLVTFAKSFDLNKMDEFGNTILHYYLKSLMHNSNRTQYEKDQPYKLNPTPIIEEFVKNGIDINAQSQRGPRMNTPLSLSIGLGYKSKEIFDTLIAHGADINKKVGHGNSVLSKVMMIYNRDKETNGYIIERLIALDADIHSENDYGISAYSSATEWDDSEILKYFNTSN